MKIILIVILIFLISVGISFADTFGRISILDFDTYNSDYVVDLETSDLFTSSNPRVLEPDSITGQVSAVSGGQLAATGEVIYTYQGSRLFAMYAAVFIPIPDQCTQIRLQYDVTTSSYLTLFTRVNQHASVSYTGELSSLVWSQGILREPGTRTIIRTGIPVVTGAEYVHLISTITNRVTGTPQMAIDNITISCGAIAADFDVDPVQGCVPLDVTVTDRTLGEPDTREWNMGDGNIYNDILNFVHSYTQPGVYTIELTAIKVGDELSRSTETIYADDCSGGGGGAGDSIYRPVRNAELDPQWGMFDYQSVYQNYPDYFDGAEIPEGSDIESVIATIGEAISGVIEGVVKLWAFNADQNTVLAFSSQSGANVHAPVGGIVISVKKMIGCDYRIAAIHYYLEVDCIFKVPQPIAGSDSLYQLDQSQLWEVIVELSDGSYLEYVVNDPQVSVNDVIDPGCIIGKTIDFYQLITLPTIQLVSQGLDVSNVELNTLPVGKGVTFITQTPLSRLEYPTAVSISTRLFPRLLIDPTSLTPCNADPAYASCATDAELRNPAEWVLDGGVIWDTGGKPILQPGGSLISGDLLLSSSAQYSLTVNIRRVGTAGAALLRLGGTDQSFQLTTESGSYVIQPGGHEADRGELYSASVTNTGTEPFEVLSFCVAEGLPEAQPATCYFVNPSFDDGLSGWTFSTGVVPGLLGGEIIMPDQSTISQLAKLYPNGASQYEYAVTIRAVPYGTGWETETNSEVSFSWQYPLGESWNDFLSPASTPEYMFSAFKNERPNNLTAFAGNEVLFQAMVPVTTVTDSVFTIRANVDLDPGFGGGILIREVCINDPFSQWSGTGGQQLPWSASCAVVSPPTDESIGSWIYFLWSSLDRFFQCDLMTLLNRIFNTMFDTYRFIQWSMLYVQSSMSYFAQWSAQSLFPWLNGHFRNIAVGQVTTINNEGSAGLFDVLLALIEGSFNPLTTFLIDVLSAGVQLVLDLVTALLSIVISVFGFIWQALASLINALGALVNAWNNAEPVVPEGFPDCAASYESNGFCLAMWVAENTVFGNTWGLVLIPLIIGFGSINLLLHLIAVFRGLANDLSANT
jgi:PKD repeat protein